LTGFKPALLRLTSRNFKLKGQSNSKSEAAIMLGKLMEVIQNQSSENENSFSGFNFEAFRLKSAQTLKQAFRSMDEISKQEFLAWLTAVRAIRNDSSLSYREKEAQISSLRNTETAFRTLKAVMDAAIDTAPEQNQKIIRTSLSGIAVASSLMKTPAYLPMAMILFGQALPKFLLTPQFEVVASFLEKELEQELKQLSKKS
jgi:hypothetical protein